MWKIITALSFVLPPAMAVEHHPDALQVDLESMQKNHWSQQEIDNVELVAEFVQKLMNEHDFEYVLEHFNDSRYVQHNRNIPDKVEGLVGFLSAFVEQYPDYAYDVKHIYADGSFVVFHSHATLRKEDRGNDQMGLNIIDTWRIEDGKIVEHWDAIQALDEAMRQQALVNGGIIRNDNGVF